MSELRPQHNSAYGFGTDRNLPQPNQGEVNTKTHLSNKVSLLKTSKREMSQRMKAELSNVKSMLSKDKIAQVWDGWCQVIHQISIQYKPGLQQ